MFPGNDLKCAVSCYRRELKLDLPPGSYFLWATTNGTSVTQDVPSARGIGGSDSCFVSEDVIVAGNEEKKIFILVGAVTARRSLTFLTLFRRATNMDRIEVCQPDILEGEEPEEVVILRGDDWQELLKQYAEIAAEKAGVEKVGDKKNLIGYCSWYYYYADVTEKDFLDAIDQWSGRKDAVVQIDDGYQTFQGDWNDQNDRWKTPLKSIAERMTERGLCAGIWLMPFVASTASRVFRAHPEWFVKDENGEPKLSLGWSPPPDHLWACLDMTVPAAREHIANVFRTFRSWGFRYFKLDGLSYAMMAGTRSDATATATSAYRLGLDAIRRAVPDSYILACSSPMLSSLGLVDGARVSADTHASWRAVHSAARSVFSRWWMIDRWWRCDPDAIITRRDRSTLTLGEARVSALTGIITGVSITSDNFATITPERMEIMKRAQELRIFDPIPIDWRAASWQAKSDGWPYVLKGRLADGRTAIAAVNPNDAACEFDFASLTLDPEKEAEELLHPLGKRKYTITIEPHDAVILAQ